MTRFLRPSFLTASTLVLCGGLLEAGSIEGLWLVESEEARIRIERCGDELCARIVWMAEPDDEEGRPRLDSNNPDESLRDRPILGINLFKGVPAEPNEDGAWTGGRIYDPQRGRFFRCTLRMEGPDRLRMRGYLGIPLLGRTTHWTRIAEEGDEDHPEAAR